MNKRFVVLVGLGLLATACSKSIPSGSPAPAGDRHQMLTIPAANNTGTKSVVGQKSFVMEARSDGGLHYFNPTVLTGTPGQTITLELKSGSGLFPHNFTLPDQNLSVDLGHGKTEDVTVTFPQSGVLQFYCEFHVGSGMIGELTVFGRRKPPHDTGIAT